MSCRETLASEFQWKNFGFNGVSREKFYLWQWRVPPIVIVIYKILLSAYLISTLLYNFRTFESDIPWPAFLTSWTYTLLTTYHVVHTVVVLHHTMSSTCHTCLSQPTREEHQRELTENFNPAEGTQTILPSQEQNNDLPRHLIILWILYGVINAVCPGVTIMWYATVATTEDSFLPQELFVHALNTVVVLVDQMICAIPVRLLHFTFPIAYGLVYSLFSGLYWMAEHKHVLYGKVLDWNHPAIPFGMVFATSCLAAAYHGVSYGIYRARLSLYHTLERSN
ncbi:protein rolling stone-like [Haliotis rubra]|uniref:protein rolling stone-like n=1 Tax=Haliotis rubra TaxID=36100 RepID=UPI001EE50100|nr:protein rolling stone-like [Haliotis rubra]